MNLENKAVKGVLWSFIEKWGGQLISTAVFFLLARLLGPEAFGVIALASVFIAFMSAFVNQGFAPAIIQRQDLENGHLDTAFWMSITSGCLLMLGTVLSAGLI
ncbi:MAG: oligosaccharide flippase family protein, partial [Leptolyngbya sp. SIO3F4]|nr:oligosaccharide flippase family protein [Leptolyngbya sp. SIO3F4]